MTRSLKECRTGVLVCGLDTGTTIPDKLLALQTIAEIGLHSYEMMELRLIRLGADPYYLELNPTDFHLGSDDVYIQGEDSKIGIKAPQINAEGTIKLYNQDSAIVLDEDSVEINATQILINGVPLSATVAQEVEKENGIAPISSVALINYLGCYPKWPQMSAYVDGWMTLQIPDNGDPKKPNRATRASAVIDYVAGQLTNYTTTTLLEDDYPTRAQLSAILDAYAKSAILTAYTKTVDLSAHLTDYAKKTDLPEVPTLSIASTVESGNTNPVSSAAVYSAIQAIQPPTIEFKTEFINCFDNWQDLSTCWILLHVCHIEINMIPGGLGLRPLTDVFPIGILKPGMPAPSEDVNAQLAGLSGILTLRLESDGIIHLSSEIEPNSQINVSIFYTFTEYIPDDSGPEVPVEGF
jgi:hypothetical protein